MSIPSLARIKNVDKIPWSSLEIGKLIGQGGYSEVYIGKLQGRNVAVKQLLLKRLTDDLVKEVENEVTIMQRCNNCAQIVTLLGVCLEEGHNAMILEYMEKKSLFEVLKNHDIDLPWQLLRLRIAIDIGKGLSFLHSREILHRDLKSHNVLLDANFNAKISDFGLSKIKLETRTTSTMHKQPMATIRWKAPELFKRGAVHTKETDVYSYGMILWEIASRQLPFSETDDDLTVISWLNAGEQEKIPADCPTEYGNLVQTVWNKHPGVEYVVKELQKLLPKPKIKPWQFDPETKLPPGVLQEGFSLLPASEKDFQRVVQEYNHCPVPGLEVSSVKTVWNPTLMNRFISQMQTLQSRQGKPVFQPDWQLNNKDKFIAWREYVHGLYKSYAEPYIDEDFPNVAFLPVWHGTSEKAVKSICEVGFVPLATTDRGFFGPGIYSTLEARYSYDVYYKGGLFLSCVGIFSDFPFIQGDSANEPMGKYDARIIPVSPTNPDNPKEKFFKACPPVTKHKYVEVIAAESASCLPMFLVELSPIPAQTKPLRNLVQPSIAWRPTSPQIPSSLPLPPTPNRLERRALLPPPPQRNPVTMQPIAAVTLSSPQISSSLPLHPLFFPTSEEKYRLACAAFDNEDYAVAVPLFEELAKSGHIEAHFYLGDCHDRGKGVDPNPQKAFEHFKFAADQGHIKAQILTSSCYYFGQGVNKSEELAFYYAKCAADQGSPTAQNRLGFMFDSGIGTSKDPEEAMKYYTLALNQNHEDAHFYFGNVLYYGTNRKIGKNYIAAVEHFKIAAKKLPEAQYNLGICFKKGKGVPQDNQQAFLWLKRAADGGIAKAQHEVGLYFEKGKVVPQDDQEAARYLKLAAENGYKKTTLLQTLLGRYPTAVQPVAAVTSSSPPSSSTLSAPPAKFVTPEKKPLPLLSQRSPAIAKPAVPTTSSPQISSSLPSHPFFSPTSEENYRVACAAFENEDYAVAVPLFEELAKSGHIGAHFYLGNCLLKGNGITQDPKKAFDCFKYAADRGHVQAILEVGKGYLEGRMVNRSDKLAFAYFKAAEEKDNPAVLCSLGVMHEFGLGTSKNLTEALRYYKLSAEKNDDMKAHLRLGKLYYMGKAKMVEKDYLLALKHFKIAATLFPEAKYFIGLCYKKGRGVSQDEQQAFLWLKKAADEGFAKAQYAVGILLEEGKIIPRDDIEAKRYLNLAAENGYSKVKVFKSFI